MNSENKMGDIYVEIPLKKCFAVASLEKNLGVFPKECKYSSRLSSKTPEQE